MSRRGTARDGKLFFLCPHRSHVLSQKKGHRYHVFLRESIYKPHKVNRVGGFKITTLNIANNPLILT